MQYQRSLMQVHVLHPSWAGTTLRSAQEQLRIVQLQVPWRQRQVLQSSPADFVSPSLQGSLHGRVVQRKEPSTQRQVLQPSPTERVSPSSQDEAHAFSEQAHCPLVHRHTLQPSSAERVSPS
ncbi:MAG: hypothetical protein B6A08_17585 [Sorangiineae bacterium NIC37A_2]|nr:MAG: hypothetical protein B6A08_17585 [Sorangiineae bacterium NIC37A_2]